jgi:hypothetical protein
VTVRLRGGSVGNLMSTVTGVPRFHAGEAVILFLQPTPRGDFSIVSWVQRTFRIHRDTRSGTELVVQDTAAFDTYDPATRQFDAEGIRNLPVAALRLRLQYPDPNDTLNVGAIRGRIVPANPFTLATFAAPSPGVPVSGMMGAHVVAVDAETGSVIAGTLAGWSCDTANLPDAVWRLVRPRAPAC